MFNASTQGSAPSKPISHADALRALGAYVQLTVLSYLCTFPPAEPADGDRYIVPPEATGAWSGHGNKVALWQDAAWSLFAPTEGWHASVGGEGPPLIYDGATWRPVLAT